MLVEKMDAWCVIRRDDVRGEHFAEHPLSFHPLAHAIHVAICLNEAHARVLIAWGEKEYPERYAGARVVPVVVEIREISEEEEKP